MLLDPPDVLTWARESAQPPVDLGLLEAHALQGEPELLEATGGYVTSAREPWYEGFWGNLVTGVGLALLILPVGGMAAFLTGADARISSQQHVPTSEWSDRTKILVAAVCFWLTVASLLVRTLGMWLARKRFWDSSLLFLPGWSAVFAAITLVALHTHGVDLVRDPAAWPVLLTIALAVLIPPALVPVSKSKQTHDQQQVVGFISRPQDKAEQDVKTALLSVSAERQEALLTARNQALDLLAHRGVIDEALHERATGAELGALAYLEPARD